MEIKASVDCLEERENRGGKFLTFNVILDFAFGDTRFKQFLLGLRLYRGVIYPPSVSLKGGGILRVVFPGPEAARAILGALKNDKEYQEIYAEKHPLLAGEWCLDEMAFPVALIGQYFPREAKKFYS